MPRTGLGIEDLFVGGAGSRVSSSAVERPIGRATGMVYCGQLMSPRRILKSVITTHMSVYKADLPTR